MTYLYSLLVVFAPATMVLLGIAFERAVSKLFEKRRNRQ